MTLASEISIWLSSAEKKVDVMFLTKDPNILDGLIDSILENENVDNVILSFSLKDSKFFEMGNDRIINISTFKSNQKPMYCFLDFENTKQIMGEHEYSEKIEWEPLFRRNCISIMTYKYTGSDINSGYWNMESKDDSLQVQRLKLSGWGEISQKIDRYTNVEMGGTNVHNRELSEAWIKSIQHFIEQFIRLLFEDCRGFDVDSLVEHFHNKESMEIIVRGFTHATHNAVYNYESLEHLGDNLFRSHFSNFTHSRFERITPQEATGYQLQYLSSQYQCIWSDDLFLFDRMIKHNCVRYTKKAKTDIIESFFGVLSTIAKNYMIGFNHVIIEKLMNTICMSLPFDKSMIFGKAKQRIIQINEKLGFESSSIVVSKSRLKDGKIELKVSISDPLREYFERRDRENHTKDFVKNGLETIGRIKYCYNPTEISEDNADDVVWKTISLCYEANDISFSTTKIRDNIFNIIKTYDVRTYEELLRKLYDQYEIIEDELIQLNFSKNLYDNFIIMYFLPAPNGEGFLTTRSWSRYISSESALSDYENPYEGKIQSENLSVIPYATKAEKIGSYELATPLQYGKYLAVLQYISM